ncbi:hypothetical protein M5K25_026651 [Dendrobium thyrsiflorum]|uniref:Reverse transcriptase domain-containing protein n=1 Tax=Dendrobium thyrsiflorum TaxID=117978 RepID=A0ABD0TY25_DENTH
MRLAMDDAIQGVMDSNWKDTLIVLIPKKDYPMDPSNYRTISLCKTIYKLVEKILLNRMVSIIPKLISPNQAAFIKGHSLSDHILIAQEIFHKFRYSKASKGLVSFKVDVEKAYDSMDWRTLEQILKYFGFPSHLSTMVIDCIENPRYFIFINGNSSDWIKASNGFRQGCPLSPFLFVLCSQLLSNALFQEEEEIGVKVHPKAPRISHLIYVDDILTLSEANLKLVIGWDRRLICKNPQSYLVKR